MFVEHCRIGADYTPICHHLQGVEKPRKGEMDLLLFSYELWDLGSDLRPLIASPRDKIKAWNIWTLKCENSVLI